MAEPTDLDEALGASLASFTLSVSTLRLLRDDGVISPQDAGLLVATALQTLERLSGTHPAATTAARELLSGVAEDLGAKLRKPS